ncbi:hypothetical protein B0T26DRAFT_695753 [Lasiosphaeria miniovina]|uniref:Uncharacterized protein n=1 Tax=Lasiosphaeria miniovina TaxID=1954250 RepID=A0AA40E9Z8_9PEZI|nr:uncharacterized protein B0T26DRAFT_695753 [Lasiosphaeria miniovina]KAK0727803.1 hypothetical protein B0T26DRAFT_695753 [Lasiosphaeria miniovina]
MPSRALFEGWGSYLCVFGSVAARMCRAIQRRGVQSRLAICAYHISATVYDLRYTKLTLCDGGQCHGRLGMRAELLYWAL